jgi:hypothetical protein
LLPPAEKNRIVAWRVSAIAADGERGIDGKPLPRFKPRFIEATQFRQGDGEVEMRGRKFRLASIALRSSPTASSSLARKTFTPPDAAVLHVVAASILSAVIGVAALWRSAEGSAE